MSTAHSPDRGTMHARLAISTGVLGFALLVITIAGGDLTTNVERFLLGVLVGGLTLWCSQGTNQW